MRKELEIKLTRRGYLRLRRGKRTLTIRGIAELEKVAHQAWDIALLKRGPAKIK